MSSEVLGSWCCYLGAESEVVAVGEELPRFLAAVSRGRVRRQVHLTCVLDPVQSLDTHTHTKYILCSYFEDRKCSLL